MSVTISPEPEKVDMEKAQKWANLYAMTVDDIALNELMIADLTSKLKQFRVERDTAAEALTGEVGGCLPLSFLVNNDSQIVFVGESEGRDYVELSKIGGR